jgi:hypothetical protein
MRLCGVLGQAWNYASHIVDREFRGLCKAPGNHTKNDSENKGNGQSRLFGDEHDGNGEETRADAKNQIQPREPDEIAGSPAIRA